MFLKLLNKTSIFYLFLLFISITPVAAERALEVDTVTGKALISDPVIIELLESPFMQRLKHVDQHGMIFYFTKMKPFTRYDHSVGVYLLVKRAGGSQEEQIAALLHDASHTVFSHTADFLFEDQGDFHHKHSYQDTIHLWFLEKMGIHSFLKKHDIDLKALDPDLPEYTALEQSLPDMCADRIQYNINTGLVFDLITQEEATEILDDLHFENGKWFFKDPKTAYKFAYLSLYFTEHFWAGALNECMNIWGGDLLRRAIEIGIIAKNDIHFGRDREVLGKIQKSQDPQIQKIWKKLQNPNDHYKVGTAFAHTYKKPKKFRGIDPLVELEAGKLQRLTEISPHFKEEHDRIKTKISDGVLIQWLPIATAPAADSGYTAKISK